MSNPIEAVNAPLLSQEFLKPYPKVAQLIEEFGLLPPTEQAYTEINETLKRGLPLVKSLSEEATAHLLKSGKLLTEQARNGEGFDVIYASMLQNKAYGPITLVLSPDILLEGRFEAYCIDHASTYLKDQVNLEITSDDDSYEKIKELERKLMEKYALTPQEFTVFYSYCVASLVENEEEYVFDDLYEERLRFITFDIGLPEIEIADVVAVLYKQGWGDVDVNKDRLKHLCEEREKGFLTIEKRAVGSEDFYKQETEITNLMMEQFQVPDNFREWMTRVA